MLELIVTLQENSEAQLTQECNLKLRIKPEDIKIPVIFHNLRGFDSHVIMQQIGEIAKNHTHKNKKGEEQHLKMNAMHNNMKTYIYGFHVG